MVAWAQSRGQVPDISNPVELFSEQAATVIAWVLGGDMELAHCSQDPPTHTLNLDFSPSPGRR